MEFEMHKAGDHQVAELRGDGILIHTTEDAVDLLGNANFQGAGSVIVHSEQLHEEFFNLKSGIAGDILQKFSNYRMKLAIVGDFKEVTSKSLRDFIYESNKRKQIIFSADLDEAIQQLASV